MNEVQLRQYMASLAPGLRAGHPDAYRRLAELLAIALPPRFKRLHLLQPEIEEVVARCVQRLGVEAAAAPVAPDELYDHLMTVADEEARRWLHELQYRRREWNRARDLQIRLLPGTPQPIAGLEIACRHRPARDLTGDFYGFYDREDALALIALGDVEGKGPAAAMYGALVMGCLRSQAFQQMNPPELLRTVNSLLPGLDVSPQSATMVLMLWDKARKQMTIANAGSPQPLFYRQGVLETVDVKGVPTGMLPNTEYEHLDLMTRPGDLLIVCSDGVTDQEGARAGAYGRSGLEAAIHPIRHEPVLRIVDAVFKDLDRFAAGAPLTDDQTVLVIRVAESPSG